MTKDFHISDVLTITTGILVSRDGMDGVYQILNWLTGDMIYTHQIPRVMRECAPELLRQFPALGGVQKPTLGGEAACAGWVAYQTTRFGKWLSVERMAGDDHTPIDPVQEAVQMFGKDRVFILETKP